MQLIIDSANIEKIKYLHEYFPIDGVTTNPTIIVKEKKSLLPTLCAIREIIGEDKELFVQTVGDTAEEMVEEAHYINKALHGEIVVKIPVTVEGIKAIKQLKQDGIRTLATTIYTPMSAYIAAKAGAEYVAPYVNRIDNLNGNGIQVVQEIVEIFAKHQLSCKVLGASFKNVRQMHEVCLAGAEALTAAPELIEAMLMIPSVEANVQTFKDEWIEQYGEESKNLTLTE